MRMMVVFFMLLLALCSSICDAKDGEWRNWGTVEYYPPGQYVESPATPPVMCKVEYRKTVQDNLEERPVVKHEYRIEPLGKVKRSSGYLSFWAWRVLPEYFAVTLDSKEIIDIELTLATENRGFSVAKSQYLSWATNPAKSRRAFEASIILCLMSFRPIELSSTEHAPDNWGEQGKVALGISNSSIVLKAKFENDDVVELQRFKGLTELGDYTLDMHVFDAVSASEATLGILDIPSVPWESASLRIWVGSQKGKNESCKHGTVLTTTRKRGAGFGRRLHGLMIMGFPCIKILPDVEGEADYLETIDYIARSHVRQNRPRKLDLIDEKDDQLKKSWRWKFSLLIEEDRTLNGFFIEKKDEPVSASSVNKLRSSYSPGLTGFFDYNDFDKVRRIARNSKLLLPLSLEVVTDSKSGLNKLRIGILGQSDLSEINDERINLLVSKCIMIIEALGCFEREERSYEKLDGWPMMSKRMISFDGGISVVNDAGEEVSTVFADAMKSAQIENTRVAWRQAYAYLFDTQYDQTFLGTIALNRSEDSTKEIRIIRAGYVEWPKSWFDSELSRLPAVKVQFPAYLPDVPSMSGIILERVQPDVDYFPRLRYTRTIQRAKEASEHIRKAQEKKEQSEAALIHPDIQNLLTPAEKKLVLRNIRLLSSAIARWTLNNNLPGDTKPCYESFEKFLSKPLEKMKTPKQGQYFLGDTISDAVRYVPSE